MGCTYQERLIIHAKVVVEGGGSQEDRRLCSFLEHHHLKLLCSKLKGMKLVGGAEGRGGGGVNWSGAVAR